MGTGITFGIAFAMAALSNVASYILEQRAIQAMAAELQASRTPTGGPWRTVVGLTLGTALYYYVGSWWFKLRVKAAGGDLDSGAARSAYFVSVLLTLPVALLVIVMAMSGAAPKDPFDLLHATLMQQGVLYVPLALGCFWLFFISKRHFGIRTGAGAMLLIFVPIVFYVVVMILGFKGVDFLRDQAQNAPGVRYGPAPVDQTYQGNGTFPASFTYPSNWRVQNINDPNVAAAIGSQAILVQGPSGGEVRMVIVEREVELDAVLEGAKDALEQQGGTITPLDDISEFGGKPGIGRQIRVTVHNQQLHLTLFLARPSNELTSPVWIQAVRLAVDSGTKRTIDDLVRSLRSTSQ